MIVDKIENRERYFLIGEGIERALRYLAVTDFSKMESGRYSIEGDSIFAIIDEYNLRDSLLAKLEAHRKYVDVQFMAQGSEKIGYAPLHGHIPEQEYSIEQDIAFYDGNESPVALAEGMFMILFPGDLHKPALGDPTKQVKKVVVKIEMTLLSQTRSI